MFRQDRQNRPNGGLLTLVRNNIPAAETQRSGQADLDMDFLRVKLVLPETPVSVVNINSPPDKQIQHHNVRVDPQSWIITGDVNSHSPSWGYQQLDKKGIDVENWVTENQLVLLNTPDDPHTRTTSTPDLAIATDDIHGIAEREVSPHLGGSDQMPVIINRSRPTEQGCRQAGTTRKPTGTLSGRRLMQGPQLWNCQTPTTTPISSTQLSLTLTDRHTYLFGGKAGQEIKVEATN